MVVLCVAPACTIPLSYRGYQPDSSDFRRYAEAIRRAPIARTAAHVHRQILQSIQAAGEGLEESHEQVPGPELAAVSVSRELHVEAGARRRRSGIRLVSEQDLG